VALTAGGAIGSAAAPLSSRAGALRERRYGTPSDLNAFGPHAARSIRCEHDDGLDILLNAHGARRITSLWSSPGNV